MRKRYVTIDNMNTDKPIGCINCRTTESELGHHEFQNLLGEKFLAYFCFPCYAKFNAVMETATPAQEVGYYLHLSRLISGKTQIFPIEMES